MSDNWQAGERRSADRPAKYRPNIINNYNYGQMPTSAQMGQSLAARIVRYRQENQNRWANQASQEKLRMQQQEQEYARRMAALEAAAQAAQARYDISYRTDDQQRARVEAAIQAANRQYYNGAGSAANQYAQQAQAYARARAAATAAAYPNYYNGPGSAGNLYAQQAQATYAAQTGQQWYNLRKQQAAYKANINQAPDPNLYYFGPGSMEQFYATKAFAEAPLNIPTVPNTQSYGYGGGYGYGYGGGGTSYAAPAADIPAWLYGVVNWRYR